MKQQNNRIQDNLFQKYICQVKNVMNYLSI